MRYKSDRMMILGLELTENDSLHGKLFPRYVKPCVQCCISKQTEPVEAEPTDLIVNCLAR